ncbi:MAG: YdbL family protein [Pseudomonadales bacterium]|nr:YdbL family protein [Pseudomonadales bacterium]
MKSLQKIFEASLVLVLLLWAASAQAITLQEAKADGLIGEQRDGYVGIVVASPSSELRALVTEVNNQRRSRYREIAQQRGISVEQVAAVAAERAVQETQPGHYIQAANGSWVRK